jgi:alanine-synthesizing transaminase
MFVWAPLPPNLAHLGSVRFAADLLEQARVAVSPGVGFGPGGEGFVRFALVEDDERTRRACAEIGKYLGKYLESAVQPQRVDKAAGLK